MNQSVLLIKYGKHLWQQGAASLQSTKQRLKRGILSIPEP